MKNFLIVIIIALLGPYATAQYAGQATASMATGGSQNIAASSAVGALLGPINEAYQKRRKLELDNFQGSPYTSNTFAPTTIFYEDENMGKIFYRYNALNEEIEIKKTNLEEENYSALNKDKDISLMVNGKPLSFKTFITEKNVTTNGYLTLLLDGDKYDLYKRTHVKFTEGQPAQNSFVPAVPNRFTHFFEYYLQEKDVDRIEEVPQKNRKLLKLIEGESRDDLKVYLKNNDLNIKEEADLIKAVEYLNE